MNFLNKNNRVQRDNLDHSYGSSEQAEAASLSAKEIVARLVELFEAGELNKKPEDYIASEEFVRLLKKNSVEGAIAIFDAREREDAQYERGKRDGMNEALNELRTRRSMPAPIRPGVASLAETDFFKMDDREFEKLKKKLSSM